MKIDIDGTRGSAEIAYLAGTRLALARVGEQQEITSGHASGRVEPQGARLEVQPSTRREDHVGRIVVTEFVSLDGVMEDPGGSERFKHGGWSFETNRGDEGNKFKLDETLSAEALLLGRVTYEGFAEAWPSREGEFADKFNSMPKYVVSSTLAEPDWNNSTVLKGDVVEEVAKLRQEQDGDIVVHGSARLVQTLLGHDLVDELRLMVFPVVLGSGKRLFDETSDKKPLRLVDSKVVGDGVAILIYEPTGEGAKRPDSG